MSTEPQLVTVPGESSGSRLDAFLAAVIGTVSRTRIQHAIDSGDILVDNREVKPSHRLRGGEIIELDMPEPPVATLTPEPIPIEIIHEDMDLVVVNKPAGMVVHPGAGVETGTLANALAYHFNRLSGTAGQIRPGIVHRLDKETSGLMVVAKNDYSHERVSEQFKDRKVFKLYTALVHGTLTPASGEIDLRIGRSSRNRTKMAVLKGNAGRSALTVFEVETRFREFTLLRVRIKTGRTHQIRVHMAHIGHPIVGDSTYGAGREKLVRDPLVRNEIHSLKRHFLHSTELSFKHPRSGQILLFRSELPHELSGLLSGLSS
ncbi:MAG TPA: RluA family pseudouridine synthase [Blastocatellia bacterium]|nr:RluA family pseudouridine synthase [Blastocatellia bacterium]